MTTPPHKYHRRSTSPDALRIVRFAELIRRHIPPSASVFEIGSGDGHLANLLARAGHPVVAIDRDPGEGFPTIPSSLEDYDARGQRFDCVVAQLVLHHAANLKSFVKKMVQLVDRQGVIAIDDYGWERSNDEAFKSERADLHPSTHLLAALDENFERIFYADHPYFEEGAGDDRLAFSIIGQAREQRN